MTIEEALKELKSELLDWNYKVNGVSNKGKALEMAIGYMEALPKISEEIEQLWKKEPCAIKHGCLDEVLEIIDRHLKEVEG